MELSKEIFEEITRLSNQGNELLDVQHDTSKAYYVFETALKLLPEPANKWDAFMWLQSSLGECKFAEKSYSEAYEHFRQAYNASVPNTNAFVLLRVGECAFELELDHAQEFLLQAYMVAGKEIYKSEDKKYYKSIEPTIKSRIVFHSQNVENRQTVKNKRLTGEDKEIYEKSREIASQYYEQKDWSNYFRTLELCWTSIPEPKQEYAESFELLMVWFSNACKYGYAKDMLQYIPAMEVADLSRADIGDREYYIGTIYYENEMIDKAMEMFTLADKKSKGRAFKDKKYQKLYKSWKKNR